MENPVNKQKLFCELFTYLQDQEFEIRSADFKSQIGGEEVNDNVEWTHIGFKVLTVNKVFTDTHNENLQDTVISGIYYKEEEDFPGYHNNHKVYIKNENGNPVLTIDIDINHTLFEAINIAKLSDNTYEYIVRNGGPTHSLGCEVEEETATFDFEIPLNITEAVTEHHLQGEDLLRKFEEENGNAYNRYEEIMYLERILGDKDIPFEKMVEVNGDIINIGFQIYKPHFNVIPIDEMDIEEECHYPKKKKAKKKKKERLEANPRGKELLQITSQPKELTHNEFTDRILNYNKYPGEHGIDTSTTYFEAVEWASRNIDEAWEDFCHAVSIYL